jgi:hypothetical protein
MEFLKYPATLILALLLVSCGKESTPQPSDSREILIRLRHVSMGETIEVGKAVSDSSGAVIALSKFQYYLSGIRLESENPMETFRESNSFHLVKGLDNKGEFIIRIKNVPERPFQSLVLQVGLDSITNGKTGGQGALDPGNGMYWPWSSEYKFLVMEGNFNYPDTSGAFLFHVAGNSCFRTIRIPISSNGNAAFLANGSRINLDVELSALTGAPNPVDFRVMNNVMSVAAGAGKLAENYAGGRFIRFTGIE